MRQYIAISATNRVRSRNETSDQKSI